MIWATLPPYDRVIHERFVAPHAGNMQPRPSIWDAIAPYEPFPPPDHPTDPPRPHNPDPIVYRHPSLRTVIVQTKLPEILLVSHMPLLLAVLTFIATYPVRWLSYLFGTLLILILRLLSQVVALQVQWMLHCCAVPLGWLFNVVDFCMWGWLTTIYQLVLSPAGSWLYCLFALALGWLYSLVACAIEFALTMVYHVVAFPMNGLYYLLVLLFGWLYDLVDFCMLGWLTAVCPQVHAHLWQVFSSPYSFFTSVVWFYAIFLVGLQLS